MTDSPASARMDLWVEERHKDTASRRFRVKQVLFSQRSPFQQVEVVETEGLGKMLLNDGLVMVTERDEFIYHDMLAHVPLYTHPDPRRVLIIGGGDGGSAREVLRHPTVEHCRMVEIDALVVEACRQHIPQTAACLDDPRLQLTIEDGVEFVARTHERYDVVMVDSTDPIGPATPLFGAEFYANVRRILTPQGIVVSQAESAYHEPEMQSALLAILADLFPRVHLYNYCNMSYPAGLWSFSFGSLGLCPIANLDRARIEREALPTQYYNAPIHCAAFALPEFARKRYARWTTPLPTPGFLP